ncbi:MAG TPA: YetF domain-containing protein [Alphaproteobacteria bacterium]
MDAVLRAAVIYIVLLLLFRIAGRRSLAELTAFDFILLLIIGEATQQALLGEDFSITNAIIVVVTLLALDVGISVWKQRSARVNRLIEGVPTVLVENGRPLKELMDRARVREEEILEAARRLQGLERMDQIKFAVLEVSGGITIIPK